MSDQKKEKTRQGKRDVLYDVIGKLVLFSVLVVAASWWGVLQFFKPYEERAKGYDLSTLGDVEYPSLILDREGVEIGRMFVQNRSPVTIDVVPDRLIRALVAQEDQRFWDHEGVDFIGVARAVVDLLKDGRAHSGASTLTMQLARNAFHLKEEAVKRGEGGIERKIVESFVALEIEKYYRDEEGKRKILEFYLNRVPFGHNYYGVRAAALGYFGKEPNDLSIAESASLVSCVKNPVAISPLRCPETNKRARNHVFRRMLIEGDLTQKDYEELILEPVVTNPKPLYQGKTYSYEKIAGLVRKRLGDEAVSRGGFKIHTTIDRNVQRTIEESLLRHLSEVENHEAFNHPRYDDYVRKQGEAPQYLQGACLVMNSETGEVIAHVGGRNYAHNQFDFLESGMRPLGTAFFPVLYTAAFEAGFSPATLVRDDAMNAIYLGIGGGKGIIGEWGMEVMHPSYEEREIPARLAFKQSKIAATARLGMEVGLDQINKTARNFGMNLGKDGKLLPRVMMGWEPVAIPTAVKAISSFSTSGQGPAVLRYIDRIEDIEGKVVYRSRQDPMSKKRVQFCSEESAYQTHSMLSEVAVDGNLEDRSGILPRDFIGGVKTGSLHSFSDGWTLGYNGRVACGVWVGFRDGNNQAIYEGAFAKDLSLPVFADAMDAIEPSFPSREVPMPDSIISVSTCSSCGQKSTPYCYETVEAEDENGQIVLRSQSTEYTEYFSKNRIPKYHCSIHGHGSGNAEKYDPSSQSSGDADLSHIPPIRPKGDLLIGSDPYGSELLSLVPREEQRVLAIHNDVQMLTGEETVRRQMMAEKAATLELAPPNRIIIRSD